MIETISFSATPNFKSYYQGHALVDKPKRRMTSLILTTLAALLLYTGQNKLPDDPTFVYAGLLTFAYILFGRTLFFKIKINGQWKGADQSRKEYVFSESSFEQHSTKDPLILKWEEVSLWQMGKDVVNIYSKKEKGSWICVPLDELSDTMKDKLQVLLEKCCPKPDLKKK